MSGTGPPELVGRGRPIRYAGLGYGLDDARSISTSSWHMNSGTIGFDPGGDRFNMGTADFAIEAEYKSEHNGGDYKVRGRR